MSISDIVVISVVTALASFTIALTGFGFGLISMSIYPNFMRVDQAAALVGILALIIVAVSLMPIRRYIRVSLLWPLIVGATVGVPIGVFLLVQLDERLLRIGLGATILVTLGADMLRKRTKERKKSTAFAILAGVVSGAFGGAFSVSGPPVVLYLSSIVKHKYELKANLLFYFLFVAVLRLPAFLFSGVLTMTVLRISLIVAIPLILGIVIGSIAFKRLEQERFRIGVRILLAASAISLVIRAW